MKTRNILFGFISLCLVSLIVSCDNSNQEGSNSEKPIITETKEPERKRPSDPCLGKLCQNGGFCVEGICQCPEGYSGEFCEITDKEKFLGAYTVTENCTNLGLSRYRTIISSPSEDNPGRIAIRNFWEDFDNLIYGTVRGNVIVIPRQHPDINGIYVWGTGELSEGRIQMDFVVEDVNFDAKSFCTSVWLKDRAKLPS